MIRALLLMAADVSILILTFCVAETVELLCVTDMIRWESPIMNNKAINIIIIYVY